MWNYISAGILLGGIIAAVRTPSQAQMAPAPPAAPTTEHRETRHGATVIDNYYWLREKSNPKVVQYLESENAYTEAMTCWT